MAITDFIDELFYTKYKYRISYLFFFSSVFKQGSITCIIAYLWRIRNDRSTPKNFSIFSSIIRYTWSCIAGIRPIWCCRARKGNAKKNNNNNKKREKSPRRRIINQSKTIAYIFNLKRRDVTYDLRVRLRYTIFIALVCVYNIIFQHSIVDKYRGYRVLSRWRQTSAIDTYVRYVTIALIGSHIAGLHDASEYLCKYCIGVSTV